MKSVFLGLVALAAASPVVAGEVVVTPVLGDVELFTAEIECPGHSGACFLCVNDVDAPGDHRLMVAVGQAIAFEEVTALVEGVVRPFVEVDGITVGPALLPTNATFRFGFRWRDTPFPPSCDGVAPHVTYRFGDAGDTTVSGDGTLEVLIPAAEALEVDFRISLCSQFAYFGAGCDVGGSSSSGWQLRLPGPLEVASADPGDADPIDLPDAAMSLDFSTGPGGTVTAVHVATGVAPDAPPYTGLDGYWEPRGSMAAGSFEADVTLEFDPASIPVEVDPEDLVMVVLDDSGRWEVLATIIDLDAGTAVAGTDRLGTMAIVSGVSVPVGAGSWGALKASFR